MSENITAEQTSLKGPAREAGKLLDAMGKEPDLTLSPAVQDKLLEGFRQEEKPAPTPPQAPSVETNKENKPASAETTSGQARTPDHTKKAEKRHGKHKGRYTTGEKIYDQVNFWLVKGLILAATAAIAYFAKFGEGAKIEKAGLTGWQQFKAGWQEWKGSGLYRKIEIPLREMQEWLIRRVAEPVAGFGNRLGGKIAGREIKNDFVATSSKEKTGGVVKDVFTVLGYAFASTMVLFHGGNLVAPVVRSFENHRKELVHKWNKKWGKPGDVEIGDEKFKDLPKQSWGDIVKGRMGAWAVVFASFLSAYLLSWKNPKLKMFRFDVYEEWFSRLCSGSKLRNFVKENKIGLDQRIHKLATLDNELGKTLRTEHKWGVFGNKIGIVAALDIYATAMAIVVWNFISRLSAKTREHGESFSQGLKAWAKDPLGRKEAESGPEEKETAPISAKTEISESKSSESTPETFSSKPFSSRAPAKTESHAERAERDPEQGTGLAAV